LLYIIHFTCNEDAETTPPEGGFDPSLTPNTGSVGGRRRTLIHHDLVAKMAG